MLLPGMCRGAWTRRRSPVIQRVKLRKVHLSKSCNLTSGEKISVNASSAQQFLAAHTYKLCHTAFICMKYERLKRLRTPGFRSIGARPHFCTLERDASYWLQKRVAWIWWELAWGSMQMYVKEMKHCHRCLHLFLLNKTPLAICL